MQSPAPSFLRVAPFDIVGLLEAAHDVQAAEDTWIDALLAAFAPGFAATAPMLGYTYRIAEDGTLRVLSLTGRHISPELLETWRMGCHAAPREFVESTYLRVNCATLSELAERNDSSREVWRQFGQAMGPFAVSDAFAFFGCDAERRGVFLTALLGSTARTRSREVAVMGRVGSHLATAFRLRRRVSDVTPGSENHESNVEAVLTPGGKLVHAEEPAQASTAQDRLKLAVRSIEKARGPMRRRDPEGAVAQWKALVGARWTLVDSFESDGRRYVLARENRAVVAGPLPLTERERQVLALAQLGHSTKVIAYELGIADSTVRVLLHRAAAKMGRRG